MMEAALDYIEWRAAYVKYIELREGTVLARGTRLTTRDERSGRRGTREPVAKQSGQP